MNIFLKKVMEDVCQKEVNKYLNMTAEEKLLEEIQTLKSEMKQMSKEIANLKTNKDCKKCSNKNCINYQEKQEVFTLSQEEIDEMEREQLDQYYAWKRERKEMEEDDKRW